MSSEQLANFAVTSTGASSAQTGRSEISAPEQTAEAPSHASVNTTAGMSFPQKLLNVGFCVALLLAGACFITGALYLNNFLINTNNGIQSLISNPTNQPYYILYTAMDARLVMAKLALLSCGIFIGMSFGFLGFALFLMGIKAEMDVAGRTEFYYLKLARLSPGVFVILCATVLIGICVTRNTSFEYHHKESNAPETPANTNNKPDEIPDLPGRIAPVTKNSPTK
jgi:hypothetical protein